MSILSWNCRGSGGTTVSTLSRYLSCTKANIAFISETRCNLDIAVKRVAGLPLCNFFGVSSEGRSGGLWLLRGDDVCVNVRHSSKLFIFAEVDSKDGKRPWGLLAVYGDPTRSQNARIWDEMEDFIDQCEGHACLFGDFNAIMSLHEKVGGSQDLGTPNRQFKEWVWYMGLLDLGYHGSAYTWSNRQGGAANISQRLDRALSSVSWTMSYNAAAVFHLPRFNSDHLPILIRTKPKPLCSKHSFRCENWWGLKEGFVEVCQRAGSLGNSDWGCPKKQFKTEVQVWLKKCLNPDAMLRSVEEEMRNSNSELPTDLTIKREKLLQEEHQNILLMQERYWHQRARLNWALFGDNKTKFFHVSAVTRKRRNLIRALLDADGNWVTEEKGI